jgi:hypothetical protein
VSTREFTIAWGYMQEGDKFLRFDSTANGTKVVVEREVPDLPTQNGSIIHTHFSEYHLIDGDWLDIHDGGPLEGTPTIAQVLTPRPDVSYGDIRSVLTDHGVVLDADDNLARALMDLFKGES